MNKTLKNWMFHDISHCSKKDCSRRHTCERWLAHLDAVYQKLQWVSYILPAEPCTHYIKTYWCKEKREDALDEWSKDPDVQKWLDKE